MCVYCRCMNLMMKHAFTLVSCRGDLLWGEGRFLCLQQIPEDPVHTQSKVYILFKICIVCHTYKSHVTPFAVAFAPLVNVMPPLEISNPDPLNGALLRTIHSPPPPPPPPPPPQTFSVLCFASLVIFSEVTPVYSTRLKRPCSRLEHLNYKSVFARELHIANRMPSSQYKEVEGFLWRTLGFAHASVSTFLELHLGKFSGASFRSCRELHLQWRLGGVAEMVYEINVVSSIEGWCSFARQRYKTCTVCIFERVPPPPTFGSIGVKWAPTFGLASCLMWNKNRAHLWSFERRYTYLK